MASVRIGCTSWRTAPRLFSTRLALIGALNKRCTATFLLRFQHRMAYAQLMALKLPIGSGAIESAVRRVVNLRLKGPSLFWCRASAEAILLLRSYYKAGRWNMLKRMATSHLALLAA